MKRLNKDLFILQSEFPIESLPNIDYSNKENIQSKKQLSIQDSIQEIVQNDKQEIKKTIVLKILYPSSIKEGSVSK